MAGKRLTGSGARLFIDGVELGVTEVTAPAIPGRGFGPIDLKLSFRPNWVGIWKLQATLADREPD